MVSPVPSHFDTRERNDSLLAIVRREEQIKPELPKALSNKVLLTEAGSLPKHILNI